MSKPTAADLIERLRQIHSRDGKRLSDEKLVAYLPIGHSTFNRWKKVQPEYFDPLIEMLDDAGWLSIEAIDPAPADPVSFSTALLGRVLAVLQQQPELMRHRPDLLRGLADELRGFAERLEAAAEAGRGDGTLPE